MEIIKRFDYNKLPVQNPPRNILPWQRYWKSRERRSNLWYSFVRPNLPHHIEILDAKNKKLPPINDAVNYLVT